MARRYYTFLIYPGAHGKLYRIPLPAYIFHLILGLAFAGVVTLGALLNSYGRMLWKVSNYNTVRAEREALKTRCRRLEDVITVTHNQLESLQSLAAEVALTYSFTDSRLPRFSANVLRMASRGGAVMGADYNASLNAFSMMKVTSLLAFNSAADFPAVLENAFGDSATPSIWPVRGRITAGFGQRMDPFTGEGAFHTGMDIAAPVGAPVRAAADGILFHAGPEAGYGNEALIDHGYDITTKYAHLSNIYVVVGEEVSRGQVIGAVGMSGRTTGPHLHYEVLVQGTPVNPVKYLGD